MHSYSENALRLRAGGAGGGARGGRRVPRVPRLMALSARPGCRRPNGRIVHALSTVGRRLAAGLTASGGLPGTGPAPRGLTSVRLRVKGKKPSLHHGSSFENRMHTRAGEAVRSLPLSRCWGCRGAASNAGKRSKLERSRCPGKTGRVGAAVGSAGWTSSMFVLGAISF